MQNRRIPIYVLPIVTLLISAAIIGCSSETKNVDSTYVTNQNLGKVELLIHFNGHSEDKKLQVDCVSDSTVLSILQTAQRENRIQVSATGSGATAFVSAIDGIENQNAGGDNWVYRVNDQLGSKSAGLHEVRPNDRINWTFGKYSIEDSTEN